MPETTASLSFSMPVSWTAHSSARSAMPWPQPGHMKCGMYSSRSHALGSNGVFCGASSMGGELLDGGGDLVGGVRRAADRRPAQRRPATMRARLWPLAPLALIVAAQAYLLSRQLALRAVSDEANYVLSMQALAHGESLGRDVFISQPPLFFLWLRWLAYPLGESLHAMRLAMLLTAAIGLAGRLAAIPLRLERTTLSSFLLVVMFSNSGNYALPVVLFAFGREALAFASVYFVASAILVYTCGVFVAASGRRSVAAALVGVARVPAVWAVAAAVAPVSRVIRRGMHCSIQPGSSSRMAGPPKWRSRSRACATSRRRHRTGASTSRASSRNWGSRRAGRRRCAKARRFWPRPGGFFFAITGSFIEPHIAQHCSAVSKTYSHSRWWNGHDGATSAAHRRTISR